MSSPELVTIPISHFCERARWTLEYLEIPFRERPNLQVFHRRALKRIGAGATTPALRLPQQVLLDSYAISDWANAQALPDGKALRFWPDDAVEIKHLEHWGETIACWTRLIAYHWLLPRRALLMRCNNRGAPRWQGWMLGLGYKQAVKMVRQHFGITPQRVQQANDDLLRAMDELSKQLRGTSYLSVSDGTHAGETFSELDLTLASYLAPLCLPAEYGIKPGTLPALDELPEELRVQVEAFRAHPVGEHCLRMFRMYRRSSS